MCLQKVLEAVFFFLQIFHRLTHHYMYKDNKHHNQQGFQLNTYGVDLSEYTFID